jgi:hypothetical protein
MQGQNLAYQIHLGIKKLLRIMSFDPDIVYEKFALRYPRIGYFYRIQGQPFVQYLNCSDIPPEAFSLANPDMLAHIIGQIGLAFLPFLVKREHCQGILVRAIQPGCLGQQVLEAILGEGLAEWRLANYLPVNHPIRVEYDASAPNFVAGPHCGQGALLMNGGGKDSLVAGEVLTAVGQPFTWLTVRQSKVMQNVIIQSPCHEVVNLMYSSSDRCFTRSARNEGHRPYSSLLAYLSLLPAYVLGKQYIVTANEYSANFGNLTKRGLNVNHQYTKSFEFEQLFAEFVQREITDGICYFSLLRPLYELQIVGLFAHHSKYFNNFISCNQGHRQGGYWCGKCPKCAFMFLALACFVDRGVLTQIFGSDFETSPDIQYWLKRLTDEGGKPFECVGTKAECRLALHLAAARHPEIVMLQTLNHWVEGLEKETSFTRVNHYSLLEDINRDNAIPTSMRPVVFKYFASRMSKLSKLLCI